MQVAHFHKFVSYYITFSYCTTKDKVYDTVDETCSDTETTYRYAASSSVVPEYSYKVILNIFFQFLYVKINCNSSVQIYQLKRIGCVIFKIV